MVNIFMQKQNEKIFIEVLKQKIKTAIKPHYFIFKKLPIVLPPNSLGVETIEEFFNLHNRHRTTKSRRNNLALFHIFS